MDDIDRAILSRISRSIDLVPRPFQGLADMLGVSEEEIAGRIVRLKEEGVIRRVGAVIDPSRLGWVSTLCAVDLPEDGIDEFARIVSGFDEITHNYVRDGRPNCWFTVIAPSRARIDEIRSEISSALGADVMDMPARRVFKIGVSFGLE
ncbi:MAG TPA: AsnC family transcriptional regulator [Deltaproteobacteria bacterium]|nr:AsnC family transcriptional regulator [Deltaproteobacteria bacterium]HOM29862.1 AsnC family transcriptional regulator [Deltaproteobacteria bacterium]HPP80204.1 AsnC family transcriptional regulator [Deltaproteobacteria bacterium]